MLAVLVYWWMTVRYSDQIAGLHTAIETHEATIRAQEAGSKNEEITIANLQNTIAQLQEQLKGTSPQLAAIQASRDKLRKQLQEF
jgi:hypothetical protein